MPKEIDQKWGKHVLTDLTTLAARSGQNSVSFALSADFSSPAVKVVFFPNLDVEPTRTRRRFGRQIRREFNCMKTGQGLKFNENCRIIFGSNLSGLIAAKELGMLFPALRPNMFVVSSIYNASVKVFGEKPTRAYPIVPVQGSSSILYSDDNNRSSVIDDLDYVWPLEAHGLLEGAALGETLSFIKHMDGAFVELQMLGRFPSKVEAERYRVSETVPIWLSVADVSPSFRVQDLFRDLNKWILNDYL